MRYFTDYDTPAGRMTLASDGENLTGAWFEHQKFFAAGLSAHAERADRLPVFAAAEDWLCRYFAGGAPLLSELPLALSGSAFQKEVWEILCRIPRGSVTTYGKIAKVLAARRGIASMSAQAVGGAVGRNPISIIIPCHRVVGADGSLTGYAAGMEIKRQLLALEGVQLPQRRRKK